MKRTFYLFCLTLLSPCFLMAAPALYDGVTAYVNDKVVTIDTVMQEMYSKFDIMSLPEYQQAAEVRKLFPVMRDLLIDRILILEEYEASGSQLPNSVVMGRVQEIIAKDFSGDKAKLQATLKERRMTYEMWEKQVREEILVAAMRQLQVQKKINISPAAVRKYYEAHKELFVKNATVRIRSILIAPDKGRALAEDLLARLQAGEDFATLAQAHSADDKAANGGDHGFIDPNAFLPIIRDAIVALKPGELSPIIEQSGYCTILKCEALNAGKQLPLSDVWAQAEEGLANQLGMERYKKWMDELRADAYIRIIDPFAQTP